LEERRCEDPYKRVKGTDEHRISFSFQHLSPNKKLHPLFLNTDLVRRRTKLRADIPQIQNKIKKI